MVFQTGLFTVFVLILHHHLATSCQVYPSEYAYHNDSVTRDERPSINCRKYAPGLKDGIFTENYIHCSGTQLRLTDSEVGSEHFCSSDYYVWRAQEMHKQLLFIFGTRVNLNTIILHYYSDSVRGLRNLRFYAVPDEFEVWESPSATYSPAAIYAVQPGGEPAGRKTVSTDFKFNTKKLVMLSLNNVFDFALSEVKFFTCNATSDDTSTSVSQSNSFTSPNLVYTHFTTAVSLPGTLEVNKTTTEHIELFRNNTSRNKDQFMPENSQLDIVLPVVLTAAIVITIALVTLLLLLLLLYCKRNHNLKTNVELDTTYSTLNRETKQQLQPQSLDTSADLYDQIKLSPSTGQTEHISKIESKNVIILTSPTISDYKNMKERQEGDSEKSTTEYATYAVVYKKKSKKEDLNKSQDRAPEKVCTQKHLDKLKDELVEADEVEKREHQERQRKENLEEMYAVVQKKPKKHGEEETAPPPVPMHTIESLYAVVEKKPKHE